MDWTILRSHPAEAKLDTLKVILLEQNLAGRSILEDSTGKINIEALKLCPRTDYRTGRKSFQL